MKKGTAELLAFLKSAEGWIFLVATHFLLYFTYLEVQLNFRPGTLPRAFLLRIFLLTMICLLFYIGGVLHAQRTGRSRILLRLIFLFFLLYISLLLNVTLFEKVFGRDSLIQAGEDARAHYLRYFVNLTPFQSIGEVYIHGLFHGCVSPYYVLLNLFGNLCIFAPLSFFLPVLFRAQRHWYVFLPTVTLSVIAIELLQFVFMVGSCDVDDLILNVFGAMLLYLIFHLRPLSRMIVRICGGATIFSGKKSEVQAT